MRKFAGYGFNKSHAAAYSYVAYKTGWLKNYYPAEFLASSLSEVMTDPGEVSEDFDGCQTPRRQTLGPDINESEFNYTSPKTMEIRMGLGALKGVGSASCRSHQGRKRQERSVPRIPFDLVKRVGSQLITKKRLFRSLRWPVSLIPLSLIAVSGLKMLTLSCSLLRKMKRQPTSSASSEKSRPTKCRLRKLRLGANGLEWKKRTVRFGLLLLWSPAGSLPFRTQT